MATQSRCAGAGGLLPTKNDGFGGFTLDRLINEQYLYSTMLRVAAHFIRRPYDKPCAIAMTQGDFRAPRARNGPR